MADAPTRVVLIHGAATTHRVWDRLLEHLDWCDAVAVERPRTGEWRRELAWLVPRVEGAFVVGMSGGATLGLGLVMGETRLAGALLHEPAVGRLAPELLTPIADAFTVGGTAGLARALYGPTWSANLADGIPESATAGELAMFRGFEPGPPGPQAGAVVVTTGSTSPAVRHRAAAALTGTFGYRSATIDGAGHFAAFDQPETFAAAIRRAWGRSTHGATHVSPAGDAAVAGSVGQ